MFQPLPTPQEMARWDELTIEKFGLLPEVLMENASREALYVLKERFSSLKGKSALSLLAQGIMVEMPFLWPGT